MEEAMQQHKETHFCLLWGEDTKASDYGIDDEPCITCSDQALPARVVFVNVDSGLALVAVDEHRTEMVDVSLLDAVAPGDLILVHGGVALEALEEATDD